RGTIGLFEGSHRVVMRALNTAFKAEKDVLSLTFLPCLKEALLECFSDIETRRRELDAHEEKILQKSAAYVEAFVPSFSRKTDKDLLCIKSLFREVFLHVFSMYYNETMTVQFMLILTILTFFLRHQDVVQKRHSV